ncbi:MAG: 30S ribosomal protein S8 [Candidatus Latescibacterota bacterium]
MSMTDPVADMLTRIRNACKAKHRKVDVPASNQKREIARILKDEHFIKAYAFVEDERQGTLRLYLKYDNDGESVIRHIERISRPGLRHYSKSKEVPRVLNGLGMAILSTSHGVMTDRQSRRAGVGGEVICNVW